MSPLSTFPRKHRWLGAAGIGSCFVIAACGGSTASQNPKGSPAPGEDSGAEAGNDNGLDSSAGANTDSGSGNPQPVSDASDDGSTAPIDGAACSAKGSEVVMIGDSYFALSETTSPPAGEITQHLQGLATAAGALASGDTYRHYYASGANMGTFSGSLVTPIPAQFANAVTANPDIKYVIMDGGGNDILLENTSCILASASSGISAACKTAAQNAVDAATTLFASMKTAGAQKVIYFFYPHLPTTRYPSVNIMIDYAYPLIQAACAAAPIPCYLIDTRPAFEGNDATYIGPDGIHPTTAGSDVIAGLVWSEMKQECVALSP